MPESASSLGFVAASLVVLLIPGPGVLYVVARSLGQGQRAGLVSVLGLSVGALGQVAAATAGLSAVLLASATAFGIIKMLGAGYLIYLGIRTLLARHETAIRDPRPRRRCSMGVGRKPGRASRRAWRGKPIFSVASPTLVT
jgi:threonine/homoserine/homoserine lactone efflux protein